MPPFLGMATFLSLCWAALKCSMVFPQRSQEDGSLNIYGGEGLVLPLLCLRKAGA